MAQTKGQISRAQANVFLENLFWSKSSSGVKSHYYIGLATDDPGVNCSVTGLEPGKSTGYKRRKLDMMEDASDGQITNGDIIFFPESLESWGTIKYFFIAKTEDTMTGIFSAPLTLETQIPAGYVPIFRKGALIVGLDKDPLTISS